VAQETNKRRGKRVRGNAVLSKQKIVQAAITEFALKGLDGARVDEVARRSGVNKTLLYHHVGNKDSLFTAALESTYQTIRARQEEFLAREMDPVAGLRELIRLLMSIWVEHPEFGRLLATENFHGGKHVKRSKIIGKMYQQLVETLNDLLKEGVEQGIFRKGLDAIDLYISISSLSAYYVSHHHTMNTLFNVDLMTRARLRQRECHIVDMIFRYICRSSDDNGSQASVSRVQKNSALKSRDSLVPSRVS
jgi:TetR/AcrR family transcriptional regulator